MAMLNNQMVSCWLHLATYQNYRWKLLLRMEIVSIWWSLLFLQLQWGISSCSSSSFPTFSFSSLCFSLLFIIFFFIINPFHHLPYHHLPFLHFPFLCFPFHHFPFHHFPAFLHSPSFLFIMRLFIMCGFIILLLISFNQVPFSCSCSSSFSIYFHIPFHLPFHCFPSSSSSSSSSTNTINSRLYMIYHLESNIKHLQLVDLQPCFPPPGAMRETLAGPRCMSSLPAWHLRCPTGGSIHSSDIRPIATMEPLSWAQKMYVKCIPLGNCRVLASVLNCSGVSLGL